MSTKEQRSESPEEQVRNQLQEAFAPHEESRQHLYHRAGGSWDWDAPALAQHHHDGEAIVRHLGMRPFIEVLREAEQMNHPVYRFPEAYLNAIIHVSDADKWALERGDMEHFANEPRPRRQVMEWLADHPSIVSVLEDGGREIHGHSKPGRGKSSFLNAQMVARNLEVNDDTILWLLTLDEMECTPVAPFMTVLKPAGVEVEVEANPADYNLPSVSVALDDVFRDVVEYTDPKDIFETVVPGGAYAVLPDPRFRECERITTSTYTTAWEAEEPAEVTPLRDYNHALLEVRAREDIYLHRTTLIMDEFGDLVPKRPENDENDTYAKVTEFPVRLGKLRKKNGSLAAMSHSLKRVHEDVLEKERWFMTFPRTPTPSVMAGLGDVGLPQDYTTSMDLGEAAIWTENRYAPISWPNPYRTNRWEGEISIRYPRREEAKP